MRPIGVGRRGPRGPRPARFFAEMCILHSKMTVGTALSSAKCTSRRQGALTAGRGRRERRPRRPRRRTGGATRAARTSPDSRGRRATRENVPPADVLAGCPAISRVKVRSRRLPGDLADPTGAGWDGAGTRAGPATIPACSRPIPGPARSASERGRAGGRRRRRDPGQKPRGNRHHFKELASVGAFPVTRTTESPSRQGLRPQPPVTGDRNGHRPRPASAVPGAFPPTDGARWRAAPP